MTFRRSERKESIEPARLSVGEWLDRIGVALAAPGADDELDAVILPRSTDEELVSLEAALGHPLPSDLRALFSRFGTTSYDPGDVFVEDLFAASDDDIGIASHGAQLRSWGWQIPDELLVFGGEGGDELFGIWRTEHGRWQPVVSVVVDGDLAVVGDNVASFIAGRMAAGAICDAHEGVEGAVWILEALGVPGRLRMLPPDEYGEPVMAWSNPDRPHAEPDPFDNPIPPDELRALAAASA